MLEESMAPVLTQEDFNRYTAFMFRSGGTIQAPRNAPLEITSVQVTTNEMDEWVAAVQFAPKDKNVGAFQFNYIIKFENNNWVTQTPQVNDPAINLNAVK